MTHYERLGIAADASPAEIRDAYRRAARLHHPDRNGDRSARVMADVNEAWRVLRDPQLRRDYDLSLPMGPASPRAGGPATSRVVAPAPGSAMTSSPSVVHPAFDRLASYQQPARFPWRFMAVLASIGILIVLLGVIITKPSKPLPPDNLLLPGSCVVVQPNGDAAEVNCTQAHDGIVQVVVPFGETCPSGMDPHRDRQGMGIACIRS